MKGEHRPELADQAWGERAERSDSPYKAVIDIGSNSVRLVIYEFERGVLVPLFNERAGAKLGQSLHATGRLWPQGAEIALEALRRFARLIDGLGAELIGCVATAAVRQAADGEDFIDRLRQETGLQAEVLSSLEEAHLSALGAAYAFPSERALVVDLGGASIEFAQVAGGRPTGEAISAPIGPLVLRDMSEREREAALQAAFSSGVPRAKRGLMIGVGGSWRALARVVMHRTDHPLPVHHGLVLEREDVERVAKAAAKDPIPLADTPGLSPHRAETLVYSAAILSRAMRAAKAERAMISAVGLREGVLVRGLADRGLAEDAFAAGVEHMVFSFRSDEPFLAALEEWSQDLALAAAREVEEIDFMRLARAASRLSGIARRMQPDLRSRISFDLALSSPMLGLSHGERVTLGLILARRYGKTPSRPERRHVLSLMPDGAERAARIMGAGLRLAWTLSAGSAALLRETRLVCDADRKSLTLRVRDPALLAETPRRRLEQLAEALRYPTVAAETAAEGALL